MDREFTIPDDHVIGADIVGALAVPSLWDLNQYGIKEVWELGITGKGVRVSINDTGGDENHPDIPKAVARKSFVGGDTGDRNGHGTWCISRVLGRNGIGIAPEAELIIAKVLNDGGSGGTAGINQARIWAAQEGADVISESLGGPQGSREDIESILMATAQGVQLDVAAAGNAGYNGSNTIGYPGRYLETWCIGSHRMDGSISGFSSGGREIDCATPGDNVIGARAGGGYTTMSGTSMSTPFFAGLQALTIQKRRLAGFKDIYGADAWRGFYSTQGFFKDVGEPGKDVRYGLGIPLIKNWIAWLKEPNLFVWFCLLFCLPSMAMAQEQQASKVAHANYFDADSAVFSYNEDGVSVFVTGIRGDIKPAAVVSTDAVNPLVRAYNKTKPFPPRNLERLGADYVLKAPAGSEWTIEILAQTESGWWTEYLEVKIGSGNGPQPPPIEPPPVEPPPISDWAALQLWVSQHATPGQDKARANAWAAGLESAVSVMDGKTLEVAKLLVGNARRDAFTGRLQVEWTPFFTELTAKIEAAPPTDTPGYKQMTLAIAKGLKR